MIAPLERARRGLALLDQARTLLEPFSAQVPGRLHEMNGDGQLLLSPEGRSAAEGICEVLAGHATEMMDPRFWLDFDDQDEERCIADSIQLAMQLLAAGASGALAGPLPSGEVMHSLHRLAEAQHEAVKLRLEALSE